MGLIHVLDAEVSNKIAAGEVVERPLSIVKELIENSIDAGASVINVEIRGGGKDYIRVTDNGSGMSAEDAKLCFLRHATSKIQSSSDLEAIYTLGFRGEALSSIGAVAKVKLTTKRKIDAVGTTVRCEGGEILSSEDSGAPNGTVMEVSELFYNTPARLKFLKKPMTEAGYISDIVSRYVFAHPEISFRLIRDGKEMIFSAGDSRLLNAVYAIYGKDYAKGMLELDYEYNGIHITGVIGKGTLVRANRNYESFFVNRRYIKSAIMTKALEEAYRNQIMISKFPTAILNLEVDASKVDINVHPTKLECKFSDERQLYQAVYHAVRDTLYRTPNVPEIERGAADNKKTQQRPEVEQTTFEELFRRKLEKTDVPESYKFKAEHRTAPIEFEPKRKESSKLQPQRQAGERVSAIAAAEETGATAIPEDIPLPDTPTADRTATPEKDKTQTEPAVKEPIFLDRKDVERAESIYSHPEHAWGLGRPSLVGTKKSVYEKLKNGVDLKTIAPEENDNPFYNINNALAHRRGRDNDRELKVKDPSFADVFMTADEYEKINNPKEDVFDDGEFRVIGQLFDTYILVEKNKRLLMLDQHAAHERLNYEVLKKELMETGITSQMILEPVEIKLSGREYASYHGHTRLLEELGFEITSNGIDTVSIMAAPGDVSWSDIEPLFLELLTQLEDMQSNIITFAKLRLVYTISCKAAIKANMHLSYEEMNALVKQVFALKHINTCPHGRPIVISMTQKEIEKEFKRIV